MDVDNDSDENNSEVWNEYYISQVTGVEFFVGMQIDFFGILYDN